GPGIRLCAAKDQRAARGRGVRHAAGREVLRRSSRRRDTRSSRTCRRFLGAPAAPAHRQAVLARLARRLPAGAPVVLLDDNQPRVWLGGLAAHAALAARGLGTARARCPAARELAALGFAIERAPRRRGARAAGCGAAALKPTGMLP